MTTTLDEALFDAERLAVENAIRTALAPYRAKTMQAPSGVTGRHLFQMSSVNISLCGALALPGTFPLSGLPRLDRSALASITCVRCMRALAERLSQ